MQGYVKYTDFKILVFIKHSMLEMILALTKPRKSFLFDKHQTGFNTIQYVRYELVWKITYCSTKQNFNNFSCLRE